MDKELNNKTINNKLIAVRRILELAYDREFIKGNPSKRVKNLRVERSEIEPFTAEEVSLILNYAYKLPVSVISDSVSFCFGQLSIKLTSML